MKVRKCDITHLDGRVNREREQERSREIKRDQERARERERDQERARESKRERERKDHNITCRTSREGVVDK